MKQTRTLVWRLATLCFVAGITGACNTYPEAESAAPVLPALGPEAADQYPYEITRDKWCEVVNFTLPDATIKVWDVFLRVDDYVVEQPLGVYVSIGLESGSARFDPRASVVRVGEARRSLRPSEVYGHRRVSGRIEEEWIRGGELGFAEIVVRKPNISARLVDAVDPDEPYIGYEFRFDVARQELLPFSFRLGDIDVNGTIYSFPEITFEYWSGYILSRCR
jgi:hypothetical protein